MSLKETKTRLLELLSDAENNVIALSGRWGTGKTPLWGEIMSEARDEAFNGAIRVFVRAVRHRSSQEEAD
jgi:tRNA A37 threonylcarbamoyladenosine biosynthesis protein TsaE